MGHHLVVRTLHDAHSKVRICSLEGRSQDLALPGAGTASGFGGEPDDAETFYSYTDFLTPPTIFRLDLKSGKSTVYRKPKVAFDARSFETKQVFYPAKDGKRIPMYLVHKSGIKLDGSNPTILYGSGGFGISIGIGVGISCRGSMGSERPMR